jgi:hypothetical protein
MSHSIGCKKELPLIQRSYAYQAKYMTDRIRVAPIHIGFHPANRGVQPPTAERCLELLKDIVESGFCKEEAVSGGVLVQAKPGSTEIHDFNVNACKGSPTMSPLVKGQLLGFGSLTHSHLQQILKNMNSELHLGVEKICDRDGMVSLTPLEKHDPVFALYARQGLMWIVLSSAINDDLEALDVIQAAANCKNSMAMVPHEMECIAKVSALCSKSSAVAERLSFETVRDQLVATLKGMAYDPDFQHLFALVVNLGGDNGPF